MGRSQQHYEPTQLEARIGTARGSRDGAEMVSLFQLLPDEASRFVETLIKTTVTLETVLPRYNDYFS